MMDQSTRDATRPLLLTCLTLHTLSIAMIAGVMMAGEWPFGITKTTIIFLAYLLAAVIITGRLSQGPQIST